jgi:hypothetical protein
MCYGMKCKYEDANGDCQAPSWEKNTGTGTFTTEVPQDAACMMEQPDD